MTRNHVHDCGCDECVLVRDLVIQARAEREAGRRYRKRPHARCPPEERCPAQGDHLVRAYVPPEGEE